MKKTEDESWLRRALALARRGIPKASPNPLVGCVLVKNGRRVSEGWHAAFGGPHAEAAAMSRAGSSARGSTAYVTLEPCAGGGGKKTPPCAPALVATGIRRVVAPCEDPNPNVAGRGFRELRRAGIQVSVGLLREECAALNRPFFVRMRTGRPYVILKAAASLDGRIETSRRQSRWITAEASRRLAHRMRAEVDAILVGVETVLRDDPGLTAHGMGRDPLRVVLDSRLRTPASAKLLRGRAPALLFTSPQALCRRPPAGAWALPVPQNGAGLDLHQVLASLASMGVGTVLVEGGSAVHTAFIEKGLVDELRLFLAPMLIGGASARSFFEGGGFASLNRALRFKQLRVRSLGADTLVTGYL